MLEVSVEGIRYHRALTVNVDKEFTNNLKLNYDYSFIVSYGDFLDTDFNIVNKNACLIDLSNGAESAMARFNTSSRKLVRRSDKIEGLKFHFGYDDFGFENYFDFYSSCEHERGWYPVPPDELKNCFLFSASYEGKLISGMSCFIHGERMRGGRIYSKKRSLVSESFTNLIFGSASRRIVYEMCKFGEQHNVLALDLGGVDWNDEAKAGISSFKMSLGGIVVPVKIGRWWNKKFEEKQPDIKAHGWDIT